MTHTKQIKYPFCCNSHKTPWIPFLL